MAAACAHEHDGVIAVGVRSHGCHTVGPILKQRSAFDDLQPSERLIQNQATEIITNLLGLQDNTRENKVYVVNICNMERRTFKIFACDLYELCFYILLDEVYRLFTQDTTQSCLQRTNL